MKKKMISLLCMMLVLSLSACTNRPVDTADTDTSASTSSEGGDSTDATLGVYPHETMELTPVDEVIAELGGRKINAMMLKYFFVNAVTDFYNENYQLMANFFDINVPLHDQVPTAEGYTQYATWYDYFLGIAQENLKYYVVFANAAEAEGIALDEDEIASVNLSIQDMENDAQDYGMTYEEYMEEFKLLGKGVTKEITYELYSMCSLAAKYQKIVYEGYEITDAEIEQAYNDNIKNYAVYDYNVYVITPKYDATSTDAEVAAAKKDAEDKAAAFRAALQSGMTFVDAYKAANTDASDDEITSFEASCKVREEGYYYNTLSSEPSVNADADWMFEDGRKSGDINETVSPNGKIRIVQAVKPPYKQTFCVTNIRYIYIDLSLGEFTESTAVEKANEISALIEAAEDKDAAFAALVPEYSDDTQTNSKGGLAEGITPNDLYFPENIRNWCFEDGRELYDCGYEVYESSGVVCGYFILFVSSYGDEYWRYCADAYVRSQKYSSQIQEMIKDVVIEYDDALADGIYK